jgi:hypothetical protein
MLAFQLIKWLNGTQSRQPRQMLSWSSVFMTRANTTRWYFPVGVMIWAGAMYRQIGAFCLSLHTGGHGSRGRKAAVRPSRMRLKSAIGTKRTFLVALHMSAFGGKRTWQLQCELSANDPKRTLIKPFLRRISPSSYSITSSARDRIAGGTDKPIAFAAFKLTTNSNFVGSCTGSSAGLAPFRMRST